VKKQTSKRTSPTPPRARQASAGAFPEVLVTSSRVGDGMPELRAAMCRLLHERA